MAFATGAEAAAAAAAGKIRKGDTIGVGGGGKVGIVFSGNVTFEQNAKAINKLIGLQF